MGKFLTLTFLLLSALVSYSQRMHLPTHEELVGKTIELDDQSLLTTFFPGKFHTEQIRDDTCTYILWDCDRSRTTTIYTSWLSEDLHLLFPVDKITETRIAKISRYTENSIQYALVFFDSHYPTQCEPGGTRDVCCILGATLLRLTENTWTIQGFNPDIGCYGSFSYTTTPDLYKDSLSGRQYFISKDQHSWNGGMWAFAHYHFFSIEKGLFEASDILKFYDFMSGINYWNSELKLTYLKNKTFLEIRTEGYINKDKISEMPPSDDMPPGIQQIFSMAKSEITFAFKTYYTIDGGGKPQFIRIQML